MHGLPLAVTFPVAERFKLLAIKLFCLNDKHQPVRGTMLNTYPKTSLVD